MSVRTRWGTLVASVLLAFGLGAAPPAQAAGLTPVTGFGANPGSLNMYAYVPANLPAGAPLVVALHGCTQNATDYFGHSGWATLADRWGFALVLPEQTSANNFQSCFNWFDPADSARDQGEAASIRQMVAYATSKYGSDSKRTYVTGLSAGGAMTANLLADYPDVFAGGAVDSGIPAKCATSVTQASGCQQATTKRTAAQWGDLVRGSSGSTGPWPKVAVWQGSADYVVYPANASALRDQWTNVHGLSNTPTGTESLPGGTTLDHYGDAVSIYTIAGMGHGLAVDPGSGSTQCGGTGTYYLDYICSSYYTGTFWGLGS